MSRPQRDAYSAARRLQAELARIASRRERQIQKANADFQLELIQLVAQSPPSTLKLVVAVLREDAGQLHLSRALATVIEAGPQVANDSDDAHERKTDPPPQPFELSRPASSAPGPDGNTAWGIEPAPIDAEFEEAADAEPAPSPMDDDDDSGYFVVAGQRYRYPKPGEPALELPDGTVVADESVEASA